MGQETLNGDRASKNQISGQILRFLVPTAKALYLQRIGFEGERDQRGYHNIMQHAPSLVVCAYLAFHFVLRKTDPKHNSRLQN